MLLLSALWFGALALALVWVGRTLRVPAGIRLVALPVLAVAGQAVMAQPADTLSEGAAVSRALAVAPAVRAAEAAVELARAERDVAGAPLTEPPELEAEADVNPFELPSPDDYEVAAGVAQTLERPGVRRARCLAAEGRLGVAEAERRAALFDLTADVREAVTDLAAAQDGVALAREARAAADTLAEIARLRYEAGDVSELDLRLARADAAVTAAEAVGAEAALAQAQAALARLLALPSGAPVAVPSLGELPPVPLLGGALAAGALDTTDARPDVQVAARAAEAAALEAAYRRRASRFPTFTVRAGVARSGLFFGPEDLDGTSPFDDDFRLGRHGVDLRFGLEVPLPFGGLGAREAARAEAEVRLREAERAVVVLGARSEADAAVTRVRQADRLLEGLAPLEADLAVSEELLELANRGGEIDLTTLLTQQERLREARRALLDARAEARRARLALARAAGRPAVGLPLDPNDL